MSAAPSLPLVSIMIPTYEQEDVIMTAVSSALAQNYPNLEIIVVDDASPHARYAALRNIDDPRLRLVRNPTNLGRTGNYRRAATELARGEWLVNLDGDDHFSDPDFISAAMRRVAQEPDVVIVAARCTTRHRHGETLSPSPGDVTMTGLEVVSALPRPELLFMHLATVYRSDLARRSGIYRSPAISSDWESLYRLALHGRVAFMDRNVGVWCLHGANASGSANWRALADNLEIWPAIFAAAQAHGLAAEAARQACDRCLAHFGALQMPSVMRASARGNIFRYLRAWYRLSRPAMRKALCSRGPAMRLLAGVLGYYRGKNF